MNKVYSGKGKNTCKLDIVPSRQINKQVGRNKKNTIEKSQKKEKQSSCIFMHSQIEFPKLMTEVYSRKEKNMCKL